MLAASTGAAHRVLPRRGPRASASEAAVDAFHAFRLAAADALPPKVRGPKHIDLDDLESEVARAIAVLAGHNRDHAVAAFYGALAERLGALEASRVPRFNRAWVGSRADAEWLAAKRFGVEIGVLPNVVDVPAAMPTRARTPGPTRLLFIGALAYYPNIDALRVLIERVMPLLRDAPVELHVIGRGAQGRGSRRACEPPAASSITASSPRSPSTTPRPTRWSCRSAPAAVRASSCSKPSPTACRS